MLARVELPIRLLEFTDRSDQIIQRNELLFLNVGNIIDDIEPNCTWRRQDIKYYLIAMDDKYNIYDSKETKIRSIERTLYTYCINDEHIIINNDAGDYTVFNIVTGVSYHIEVDDSEYIFPFFRGVIGIIEEDDSCKIKEYSITGELIREFVLTLDEDYNMVDFKISFMKGINSYYVFILSEERLYVYHITSQAELIYNKEIKDVYYFDYIPNRVLIRGDKTAYIFNIEEKKLKRLMMSKDQRLFYFPPYIDNESTNYNTIIADDSKNTTIIRKVLAFGGLVIKSNKERILLRCIINTFLPYIPTAINNMIFDCMNYT